MRTGTKILWAIILVVVVIALIYLNRAYAHIYDKIGDEHLAPTNQQISYEVSQMSPLSNVATYVALGDSLTAGVGTTDISQSFPYLVAKEMATKYGKVKLFDFGVPGAKSKNVLSDQLDKALALNPDYVTILIGINDIHGLVPVNAFKRNILEIIGKLKSQTHAEIILVNIPYIGSPKLVYPPYDSYFEFRTWQYNRVIKEICANNQIKCVDLYTANQEFIKRKDFYASDYFHPTAQGYLLWSNIIYAN